MVFKELKMVRDLIITVVALSFLVSLVSILVNPVVEIVKVMRASSPGLLLLVAIGIGVESHLATWLSLS